MIPEYLLIIFIVIFSVTAIVTLLGLIKGTRVTIEDRYLNWLVKSFLLEIAAAIFYFFYAIDVSKLQEDSISDIAEKIPLELSSDEPEEIIQNINDLFQEKIEIQAETESQKNEIKALKEDLQRAEKLIGSLKDQIAQIELTIPSFGGFINPNHPKDNISESKKRVNTLVQNVLSELGLASIERIDGNGPSTFNAIKEFQSDYNLQNDGNITYDDVTKMKEILNSLIEQNGDDASN